MAFFFSPIVTLSLKEENTPAYLQYKFLIYVLFGNAGLKFLAFQKSYEKLIYKLQKIKKTQQITNETQV